MSTVSILSVNGTIINSDMSVQNQQRLFCDQIEALVNPHEPIDICYKTNLHLMLWNSSHQTVQDLYLVLKELFSPCISNEERLSIINCLLCISVDQWPDVMKQVCFIMPLGTRGHDVKWATKILIAVTNPTDRAKIVNVANRLFTYNTRTVEKGYILAALTRLNPDELNNLDRGDEKKRAQFIQNAVPAL